MDVEGIGEKCVWRIRKCWCTKKSMNRSKFICRIMSNRIYDEEKENRKRDNLINNCFCVSIFKIDSSEKMFHERINIL